MPSWPHDHCELLENLPVVVTETHAKSGTPQPDRALLRRKQSLRFEHPHVDKHQGAIGCNRCIYSIQMNLSRSSRHHTETFSNSGPGSKSSQNTPQALRKKPGTVSPVRVFFWTLRKNSSKASTPPTDWFKGAHISYNSYNLPSSLQLSVGRNMLASPGSPTNTLKPTPPTTPVHCTQHMGGTAGARQVRTPPAQAVCQARRSRTSPQSKTCEMGGTTKLRAHKGLQLLPCSLTSFHASLRP